MSRKNLNEIIKDFDTIYDKQTTKESSEEDIRKEYLEYSRFFQTAFISEGGWIIDTGNFQTCNRQLIRLVERKNKEASTFVETILYGCLRTV